MAIATSYARPVYGPATHQKAACAAFVYLARVRAGAPSAYADGWAAPSTSCSGDSLNFK